MIFSNRIHAEAFSRPGISILAYTPKLETHSVMDSFGEDHERKFMSVETV